MMSKRQLWCAAAALPLLVIACGNHSTPHSPSGSLRMMEPSAGPDMPPEKRPPIVCYYKIQDSEDCYETQAEACAALNCVSKQCGVAYGYDFNPPGGPTVLSCM